MLMSELRALVQKLLLAEVALEDVSDVCLASGSTHVMKTCKIGSDKYYLKFSEESMFDESDPSLQVLVEYLAYKIYSLYPQVNIPKKIHLVFDKKRAKVGIATSPVKGSPGTRLNPKTLGQMMSAGIYVDILLANWDVVGNDDGNVLVDKQAANRIDPGGSLTFRAQGGRKGNKFSKSAGELKTMLDASFGGAGKVFKYANLHKAASVFLAVPWESISSMINSIDGEVTKELKLAGMGGLLKEWKRDVSEITAKLRSRHAEITKHAETISDNEL